MRVPAALLLVLFASVPTRAAPSRSPLEVLGRLISMEVLAKECEVTLTAERQSRLAAALERVQRRVRPPPGEMDRIRADLARQAKRVDCNRVEATLVASLEAALSEAARFR